MNGWSVPGHTWVLARFTPLMMPVISTDWKSFFRASDGMGLFLSSSLAGKAIAIRPPLLHHSVERKRKGKSGLLSGFLYLFASGDDVLSRTSRVAFSMLLPSLAGTLVQGGLLNTMS